MYRWVIWAISVSFGGLMCTLSVLAFKKSITEEDVLASSSYTKVRHLSIHQFLPSTVPINKWKNKRPVRRLPAECFPSCMCKIPVGVPRSF